MGEQEKANVSRQKTPDRISSPDHLTDYLRVTNPGIWVLLASIVLFLAGVLDRKSTRLNSSHIL